MFTHASDTDRPGRGSSAAVRLNDGHCSRRAWLVAAVAWSACRSALAQSTTRRPKRVGVLQPDTAPSPVVEALRQGLRAAGWIEGLNLMLEFRWAEGRPERLAPLAQTLVAAEVDAIATFSTPAALAALHATTTIPIIFTGVGDPVGTGLVASLAHPGGNATGLATLSPELSAKRLELLHEIAPGASRLAMLWNDTNPSMQTSARYTRHAGESLGIVVDSYGIHDLVDFEPSFTAIGTGADAALLTLADPFTRANRQRIVDFAARMRLPAMYEVGDFVESGGLISYGPNLVEMERHAGVYIDKILKGVSPNDLPVEQPTVLELFVNLKTARALGIRIPASVLARADHVIE